MIDTSHCNEYYDATCIWAREHGLYDGDDPDAWYLKRRLDYLDTYADHERKGLTKCVLVKDLAPHSFEFSMYRRKRRPMGPDFEGGVEELLTDEWEFWFNGGLIFHGRHDGGGDGGAPTFAVNLNPGIGWSIHT